MNKPSASNATKAKEAARKKGGIDHPKPSRAKHGKSEAKSKRSAAKTAEWALRRERAAGLAMEMERIRSLVREVGDAVTGRLEAEAAALVGRLGAAPVPEGQKPGLPSLRVLDRMADALGALKVKPPKGRIKDLVRLEALLATLAKGLPPEV